ncbi:helix-turn-helix domain-containing protein [Comamonas humi]
MARTARGADHLERAREILARAQTAEELRQAQAVVLPLAHGMSLQETAQAIGRSVAWTSRLRNRFLAGQAVIEGQPPARGGRRNHHMTEAQERQVLAPYLARARTGDKPAVTEIKADLEAKLGRAIALSTVYKLLHRHGWREAAMNNHIPPAQEAVQDA